MTNTPRPTRAKATPSKKKQTVSEETPVAKTPAKKAAKAAAKPAVAKNASSKTKAAVAEVATATKKAPAKKVAAKAAVAEASPVKKAAAKKADAKTPEAAPARKVAAKKAVAKPVAVEEAPAKKAAAKKAAPAKKPVARKVAPEAAVVEAVAEPVVAAAPAAEEIAEPKAKKTGKKKAAEPVTSAVAATDAEDELEEPLRKTGPAPKLERLQKILAKAGISSRRKAEELIEGGHVQVNGVVVTEMGSKADVARDHIRVDGKLLQGAERIRYFVLNKPKGFVTTVSDPEGRPTVMQFFEREGERLYPVGRLDYLSEGLLLITNDGELANKLTRAASGVEKTYLVKVSGQPTEEALDALRQGVMIERGRHGTGTGRVRTAPAQIRLMRQGDNPWYEVILIEGRNRELRKMFEEIGHHVEKIRRVGYGPLVLDQEPGKLRELEAHEVEQLRLCADGKLKKKAKRLPAMTQLPREAGRTVQYKKADGRPGYARPVRTGFKPQDRAAGGAPRDFARPARPIDGEARPSFDRKPRFDGERPAAGRPFTPRPGGDRPSFRPAGDRPAFRPGGDRPSFRPTGDRPAFRPDARPGGRPFGNPGFQADSPRRPFTPAASGEGQSRPDFRAEDRPLTGPGSQDRGGSFGKTGGFVKPGFNKPGGFSKPGGFAKPGGFVKHDSSEGFQGERPTPPPTPASTFSSPKLEIRPAAPRADFARPERSDRPGRPSAAPGARPARAGKPWVDAYAEQPRTPGGIKIEPVTGAQDDRRGPKPNRPAFARPQGDRPQFDRPQGDRPEGAKPQFDKPWSEGPRPAGNRPFQPRPAGNRPFQPRPFTPRPEGSFDRPRPTGTGRTFGDRPSRPFTPRPGGDRPSFRPAGDRPAFRPAGDRPSTGRPFMPRPGGDRPFTPRPGAPAREGGDFRPRPQGGEGRPSFGRPAFGRPTRSFDGPKPSPGGSNSRPSGKMDADGKPHVKDRHRNSFEGKFKGKPKWTKKS